MRGYEHDDEQEYINPVNVKRAQVKWYETPPASRSPT